MRLEGKGAYGLMLFWLFFGLLIGKNMTFATMVLWVAICCINSIFNEDEMCLWVPELALDSKCFKFLDWKCFVAFNTWKGSISHPCKYFPSGFLELDLVGWLVFVKCKITRELYMYLCANHEENLIYILGSLWWKQILWWKIIKIISIWF